MLELSRKVRESNKLLGVVHVPVVEAIASLTELNPPVAGPTFDASALLTQVDEHSLELYVVTPDGIAVAERVHAAVLVCVKTAAILGAVLSLGSLKEEDYMRLLKMALEPKDRLVLQAGCEHPWPCSGFNHCSLKRNRET